VTYYSSEAHKADGYNQLLCHRVSKDEGATWGREVYDVAFPGGVERPGMAIVTRLPDHRYVMTYESVAGPVPNQVYLKYSRDGLNWGDPAERGTPIQTPAGEYPANCPVVSWFPLAGSQGVLIVSARSAAGGGDPAGRSLFWNASNGEGPWWEVPAPVQKRANGRAGWTQALMLKSDGGMLHITSSASADAPNSAARNEILYAAKRLDFNRYEAEDAGRKGSALMRDESMSNYAKVRLGAKEIGRLTFDVYVPTAGAYALAVDFEDIGFPATPRLFANGAAIAATAAALPPTEAAAGARPRDLGTRGAGKKNFPVPRSCVPATTSSKSQAASMRSTLTFSKLRRKPSSSSGRASDGRGGKRFAHKSWCHRRDRCLNSAVGYITPKDMLAGRQRRSTPRATENWRRRESSGTKAAADSPAAGCVIGFGATVRDAHFGQVGQEL
jgi:hypothetical protein